MSHKPVFLYEKYFLTFKNCIKIQHIIHDNFYLETREFRFKFPKVKKGKLKNPDPGIKNPEKFPNLEDLKLAKIRV